jgi:hypothetical protein
MTHRRSVASSCDDALVSDLEAWDRRTAERLERAYLAAGAGMIRIDRPRRHPPLSAWIDA